jgi:hypothetical protein
VLERYVGTYKAAGGTTATFRLDGEKLFAKLGAGAERALVANSETRFAAPPNAFFDFQLDAQGKVVSVTLEQGQSRMWMGRQ